MLDRIRAAFGWGMFSLLKSSEMEKFDAARPETIVASGGAWAATSEILIGGKGILDGSVLTQQFASGADSTINIGAAHRAILSASQVTASVTVDMDAPAPGARKEVTISDLAASVEVHIPATTGSGLVWRTPARVIGSLKIELEAASGVWAITHMSVDAEAALASGAVRNVSAGSIGATYQMTESTRVSSTVTANASFRLPPVDFSQSNDIATVVSLAIEKIDPRLSVSIYDSTGATLVHSLSVGVVGIEGLELEFAYSDGSNAWRLSHSERPTSRTTDTLVIDSMPGDGVVEVDTAKYANVFFSFPVVGTFDLHIVLSNPDQEGWGVGITFTQLIMTAGGLLTVERPNEVALVDGVALTANYANLPIPAYTGLGYTLDFKALNGSWQHLSRDFVTS